MILNNFIAFEGIDGAGTSTQIKILAAREEAGKMFFTAEPTPSETGIFLRQVLSGKIQLAPQTAAYLFAADRAEHVWGKEGLVEKTKNGLTVVSDRYLFSSLAYQGVSCGEELPELLNSPFPLPELLFFFDISPEKSLQRVDSRGEAKEIYENREYLDSTAGRYRKIIDRYKKQADSGMRIIEIDATQSKEEIAARIWGEIEPLVKRN